MLQRKLQSPVQWAHYGDSHRGICLGFDIPDEHLFPIDYVEARGSVDEFKKALDYKQEEFLRIMLSKKHKHWEYEREWRCLVRLSSAEVTDDLVFRDFTDRFVLREVILGLRSEVQTGKKSCVYDHCDRAIELKRARMSQGEYAMVV